MLWTKIIFIVSWRSEIRGKKLNKHKRIDVINCSKRGIFKCWKGFRPNLRPRDRNFMVIFTYRLLLLSIQFELWWIFYEHDWPGVLYFSLWKYFDFYTGKVDSFFALFWVLPVWITADFMSCMEPASCPGVFISGFRVFTQGIVGESAGLLMKAPGYEAGTGWYWSRLNGFKRTDSHYSSF